ncbi:8-amino-7-oxononanoate synthase-like protein [Clohesyomyces aquaticus]|uniref:8-amino-7-oxononanoate synthase-like protein n=1 Tax=Clohesyomyces aquaticus TaxID=1231657 RepID=A0A1Y2AAI8_9PLEO|nr:8-amino-7-oxononanoate synthase-like protein [Clohesyomyces aquaticus]
MTCSVPPTPNSPRHSIEEMEDGTSQLPLEKSLQKLLDRRRANSTLRSLTINSSQQVDFSSNDFLSLSKSPALRAAILAEQATSNLPLGSGGSRLLDGNSRYAEDLEQDIAAFHRAPAGLLFNSGFDANAGFYACVPQPGDFIVYDEFIHASVHDGMRLSRAANRIPFCHNSVEDLQRVLEDCVHSSQTLREGRSHVLIAVEAVYSMDGDLAPLTAIVDIVEAVLPRGCGYVVVDEAHSTGVIGPNGRGLVCELGLEKRIFARLHTFGKALAGNGAIMLCSPLIRHYLINYARPLIYTTFMSYPALVAIRASYTLLMNGHTNSLAAHVRLLVDNLFRELRSVQLPAVTELLQVPSECPSSPIFSIQAAEPKSLARYLQEKGFMVRAVVPPTVPEGTSRVRVCLHAGNTIPETKALVVHMKKWATLQARGRGISCTMAERETEKARL